MEDFINENWWWLIIVMAWSLFWKGVALWRAARRAEKGWFILLLLVNTLGFLEIVYLYLVSPDSKKED